MDNQTGRPAWSPITRDSTREEVFAAVAEHERRAAEVLADIECMRFVGLDEADPEPGCYYSEDGSVRVRYGDPDDEPPQMARQRAAGEEDQDDGTWGIG